MANRFRNEASLEDIGQAARRNPRITKNVEAFRSLLNLVTSIEPPKKPEDHGKISESDLAELQEICDKQRNG